MKRYKYVEPDENDQIKEVVLSEEDILKEYWVFWSRKMSEKYGEDHELITTENCVRDWLSVHSAIEIKE